jgi:hypothetical protein
MANEIEFLECVKALDDVTRAFLDGRQGLAAPSTYEADVAAFKLMEVVFRHVNAFSAIAAAMQPLGSHYVSAWVLLRSAFEVGVTAYWLVKDDDWREREARWLGWMAGEEEYQRKLVRDLQPLDQQTADKVAQYADSLEQHRLEITRLLPKDSRDRRSSIPRMLEECGIEKKYYIAYRIGSHLTHGGPAVCDEVFESDGGSLRTKSGGLDAWANLFLMASWSIARPGSVVLKRSQASERIVDSLMMWHHVLSDHVRKLTT